jgi:hypothetical protein
MKQVNNTSTFLVAIISIIALLISCAEPSLPKGGPKDQQPPRINTKKYSTPNPTTNFQENQIILTFDEWIKLQAVFSEVVISPPLEETPDIKIRNKSVVVKWKEELKDSTTYTINFGDAVRDITESNIVPNLRMVFSTGPYLDSLICSGQIVDAGTRKPKSGVLVMLYQNLEDSIPLTKRPYYFSKTDKDGRFKIQNIKDGQYRIFALDDQNRNYMYDLANEQIAFLDSSFQMNDTLQPVLRLRMFEEREETKVFGTKLASYGCLRLEYNNKIQTASSVELVDAPNDFKAYVEQGLDTMTIWFDGTMPQQDKWVFIVENEAENLSDTIRVNSIKKNDFEESVPNLRWYKKRKKSKQAKGKGPVFVALPLQDTVAIGQAPLQAINLYFTRPIENWDSTGVFLFKDTSISILQVSTIENEDTITNEVTIDTLKAMVVVDTFILLESPNVGQVLDAKSQVQIEYDWEEKQRYKILLLPNTVTDFFGRSNIDTLSRVYVINSIGEYGSVTAIIKGADSTKQYLVELVNSKSEIIQQNVVRDSTEMQFVYENIKTDNYTIRIVHDELPNGRWDVGSYEENRQAEKTTNSRVITLKSGWENSMEINLNSAPIQVPERSSEIPTTQGRK